MRLATSFEDDLHHAKETTRLYQYMADEFHKGEHRAHLLTMAKGAIGECEDEEEKRVVMSCYSFTRTINARWIVQSGEDNRGKVEEVEK